jgi:hypothetical protein
LPGHIAAIVHQAMRGEAVLGEARATPAQSHSVRQRGAAHQESSTARAACERITRVKRPDMRHNNRSAGNRGSASLSMPRRV